MINLVNLKQIVKTYQKLLINRRIVDITLVNSRLFLFSLKNEKYRLLVDLDNINPHIGIINTDYDELSLPSEFIAKALNKGKPLIKNIEVINEDKIIKITTTSSDAYYHINEYHLYIELINARANMILTDNNEKIIVAFYESGLNAPRLIIRNNKYVLPERKIESMNNKEFSMKAYNNYVNEAFNNGLDKRKKELYGNEIKKHEKRIKSIKRKIDKINESKKKANQSLIYKEYGEMILMNINEIKKGDSAFNNIALDASKSPSENANLYFHKYKKAKRALETIDFYLKDALEELENTEYYLDVYRYGGINDIALLRQNNIKHKKEIAKAYLPYYINHQGTIYYFGHNALENDYLTFKMFKKSSEVIWLHQKDRAGAHLIINKNNPTNEELHIASQLLLLLNKQVTGEIMYAKRSDITRSNELGKANVINYKIINIHQRDDKIKNILKKEKRIHE